MNLNEINFSFGGKHCLRDFGCFYVEKSGHPAYPAAQLNTYAIAGRSGASGRSSAGCWRGGSG